MSKIDWFFFKLVNKEAAAGDDDEMSILMLSFSFVVVDALLDPFVSSVFTFCGMFVDGGIEVDDVVSWLFCNAVDALSDAVFVILVLSILSGIPDASTIFVTFFKVIRDESNCLEFYKSFLFFW